MPLTEPETCKTCGRFRAENTTRVICDGCGADLGWCCELAGIVIPCSEHPCPLNLCDECWHGQNCIGGEGYCESHMLGAAERRLAEYLTAGAMRRVLVVEYDVTDLPRDWTMQQIAAASGLNPPIASRIEVRP